MAVVEGERVRSVRLRTSGASVQRCPGGALVVRPDEPLGLYPKVLTDRLFHWAAQCPDRICAAKREAGGQWRQLSYRQMCERVRSVGQSLLDRGLSAERPLAILSENDLEHLLLMLAGQHVGVPTAHVSPAYSLMTKDYIKLRHALNLLTPGLVFVSSGERYGRAVQAAVPDKTELLVTRDPPARRKATLMAELVQTVATPAVDAAHEHIDPDSMAKILFTSGTAGLPKGVVNTHRMICSNQQMIRQVLCFLADEPPVLLDWLPWNHTFGGNHNTGITVYNGGTFYIDDGKPGPGLIAETIRNLREVSPTVYFNVPKGYQDLLPAFRADAELRENFFRRLRLLFYAGAGLSQPVWDDYRALALETCGERILMVSALGATETAPMALQMTQDSDRAGNIGIPVPGVEAKLLPRGEKLELRVRGPNVTPGYWRQPDLTEKAFDEEGFYRLEDAVRFVDPYDVNKGFLFDGRLSEDFKLATGTWVSVGPLRSAVVASLSLFARDVVIAGHDRNHLGVIIFPDLDACRSLCVGLPPDSPETEVLAHPAVRERFQSLLDTFAADATGASNRITRAILAVEPPSLDAGEITDKGTLSQGTILERRAALVEQLYAPNPPTEVLKVGD